MPVLSTAALNSPAVSRFIASPGSLQPRSPGPGMPEPAPQAIIRSQDRYQSIRVPVFLLVERFLSAPFGHHAGVRLRERVRLQERMPGQSLAELAHVLAREVAHQVDCSIYGR